MPDGFAFDEQSARRIARFVLESEKRTRIGARRRRQPPVREGGASLDVLGPCGVWTIDEELDDSEFDIDYGGDCTGPSRWGLTYVPVGLGATDFVTIELETQTPLLFSTATFTHLCTLGFITVFVELEFTSLDREGVELRFIQSSANVGVYQNTICAFDPGIGGKLQYVSGDCLCGTFGPEICLSRPNR